MRRQGLRGTADMERKKKPSDEERFRRRAAPGGGEEHERRKKRIAEPFKARKSVSLLWETIDRGKGFQHREYLYASSKAGHYEVLPLWSKSDSSLSWSANLVSNGRVVRSYGQYVPLGESKDSERCKEFCQEAERRIEAGHQFMSRKQLEAAMKARKCLRLHRKLRVAGEVQYSDNEIEDAARILVTTYRFRGFAWERSAAWRAICVLRGYRFTR